ncbi:MAG: ribbon-helix-helix domain-containing protein [Sulfolobales archaeon]
MNHNELLAKDFDDEPRSSPKTLSIKLDYDTLAKIDYIILKRRCEFASRSDFIRKAIIFKISQMRK